MGSTLTHVPVREVSDVKHSVTLRPEHTKAITRGRTVNVHRQMATAQAELAGCPGLRCALAAPVAEDGGTRVAIATSMSTGARRARHSNHVDRATSAIAEVA